MTGTTNYKNTINNFVDNSKAYSLDVKNRLTNLFLFNNMGLVEEVMHSRTFNLGKLGGDESIGGLTTNLVGVPKELFQRIINYYTTIKTAISAETTSIQTNFNTLSPTNNEKLYIKEVLNKTLDQQFEYINNNLMEVVNSLRKSQFDLTKVVDKLNFITLNSYDGYYQNTFGGLVTVQQLTSSTTTLIQAYTGDSLSLSNFIGEYVNPTFNRNYPAATLIRGIEYLFFSNQVYTNNSLSFTFDGYINDSYQEELKKLIRFRDGQLYNHLLKIDENGFKGIKLKTKIGFEPLLKNIVIPWIAYDLKFFKPRITNGIEAGYEVLDGQLSTYTSDFNIEFGTTTGATAQNILRNNLRERTNGVSDNKFNFKLERQLIIS
tara:strand:+ start:1838 stop:2965 length:1128 start_codon:yes stop_codon:yes gene_type:complete